MIFTIFQPNDLYRTVDIESDLSFDFAMEVAAMRRRCDDDMVDQLSVIYSADHLAFADKFCEKVVRRSKYPWR
jgi:hypothetical protein